MLDVLLKSKFYSKCKTSMKMTKMRIEVIKRKRNAIEKFLKKDIVDLLKNGLDINAYGRAEGLLIELNVSACYNSVAQFCTCLLHQVSKMDKQSDCPEECKEAASSLMYAAARFADLPELRELRAIFVDKYGKTLEANVSHEFIEKLKATPPTKELKIQLLQDIAKESGKSWDSKALEQKLYTPPPSDQALCEDTTEKTQTIRKNKDEPAKKITKKGTEDNTRISFCSPPKRTKDPPSYRTRKNDQENEISAVHERDYKTVGSTFNAQKYMNGWNSESDGQQVELDEKKSFQRKFAPAPYNERSIGERKSEPQATENNGILGGDSRSVVTSFNVNKHTNELDLVSEGQKVELDEKKPFPRKFSPAPYNTRSSGARKYEPQANLNKTTERGEFEKAPNNVIEGKNLNEEEHKNKPRYYQRNLTPVSYQENSDKTSSRDYRVASFDQYNDQNESNPKRNEHKEKRDEKKHFESKFAPPAYTLYKAEPSLIEEKKVDDAKPNPRSVRSVRSRRSMVPPDDVNCIKNDDLDAIRQELATKPGFKSRNDRKEADEKKINEILTHYYKRESPRRVNGLLFRS